MEMRNALPTLVLIHDLMGSPGEFGLLAQILGAREVAFDFIEIPGYTEGIDRPVLDWRGWVASASASLERRHGADQPIVIGGIGTGAALAAALAHAAGPRRISGITLLSPTFDRDGATSTRSTLDRFVSALGVDRWTSVKRTDHFGVKNPKTRKWIARELEEQGVSSIGRAQLSRRAILESTRLHAHVRPTLKSLPGPLLILHATQDDVTSIQSVTRLVDEIGRGARLVALEHSYRMITLDNDRQRVAHELADFLGAPKRRPEPPRVANPRVRTSVAAS